MKIYFCSRCNEKFFIKGSEEKKCISCGNEKISDKRVEYNPKNTDMTIENFIPGEKEDGIIRIDISGERKKAAFECQDCKKFYEADCTEGINLVTCPECYSGNKEIKSPIVSVFAGVKGIPNIKRNWTKKEKKIAKFARNCYLKREDFKNQFKKSIQLARSLNVPDEIVSEINRSFDKSLQWIDKYHEKKIEEYGIED